MFKKVKQINAVQEKLYIAGKIALIQWKPCCRRGETCNWKGTEPPQFWQLCLMGWVVIYKDTTGDTEVFNKASIPAHVLTFSLTQQPPFHPFMTKATLL